jgi:dephospho-CoA kinase
MPLLGLTGGVGMGKSTAANVLAHFGAALIDTDAVARELVEPGQPALAEIQARWGPAVIGPDGGLRRDALAERVFQDTQARKELESILHPRIRQTWLAQVEAWRNQGRLLVVVVIPLLFETDAASHFDASICVACSDATQAARLRARGWSDAQIAARVAAQWPVGKKMDLADFVIWSEGSLDVLSEQLKRVLASTKD